MDKATLMSGVLIRLKAAIAAFRSARVDPYYAVIYDHYEGLDPETDDRQEEFYEAFDTPEEAAQLFRTAFQRGEIVKNGETMVENPRLVMILGAIDKYHARGWE